MTKLNIIMYGRTLYVYTLNKLLLLWDPTPININKLVILVQSIYLAQVVEYSLGCGKKSDLDTEGNDKHKVEETVGLFPPSKPKVDSNNYDESFREFNSSSQLMKSMMGIEDHINHRIGTVITTGPGQGHLKTAHTGKDTDASDRRYRHDGYTGRSDSGYNNHLTLSQHLEVKLFLDKISYFNG